MNEHSNNSKWHEKLNPRWWIIGDEHSSCALKINFNTILQSFTNQIRRKKIIDKSCEFLILEINHLILRILFTRKKGARNNNDLQIKIHVFRCCVSIIKFKMLLDKFTECFSINCLPYISCSNPFKKRI